MAKVYSETIADTNTFLSNFATGYSIPNPVADFVAPKFQVKFEDGKYVEYTKSVLRIWDDRISGDEEPKEIQWNVDEATYSCYEYAMGKFVSDKAMAQAVDPINLGKDAVKMVKQFHELAREYRIEQIAGNAALVTQTSSPAIKWSASGGLPITDIIKTAVATIEDSTVGHPPNKILIQAQVAYNMILTDEWKDYFKYTEVGFGKGLWSVIEGLKYMGLEPMIAHTQGLSEAKCTASDPTAEALWEEKCLVFYSEATPTLQTRTLMYSPFVKTDVVTTTRMPRRRGEYHDIYSDIDELLVDATCGYLFTDCL